MNPTTARLIARRKSSDVIKKAGETSANQGGRSILYDAGGLVEKKEKQLWALWEMSHLACRGVPEAALQVM